MESGSRAENILPLLPEWPPTGTPNRPDKVRPAGKAWIEYPFHGYQAPAILLKTCLLAVAGSAILALFTGSIVLAAAPVEREFSGLSAGGPTGSVLAPNATLLRSNWYAIGLHRGIVKAVYGFFDAAEAGFVLPDLFSQPNATAWQNQSRVFTKIGFDASDYSFKLPALAVGAENSYNWENESIYGVATWFLAVKSWRLELNGGYGTGRFNREPFGGIGVIPVNLLGNTIKFVAEYAGHQADIGARIALARSLRLDFVFLINAVPPSAFDGKRDTWYIRIDKGFLGASRADRAFRVPDAVPKGK